MMEETRQRKKTGPKPLYGEAKKMVSFRLSPEALAIIKNLADDKNISQAEVIEQWARQFRKTGTHVSASSSVLGERELVGAER